MKKLVVCALSGIVAFFSLKAVALDVDDVCPVYFGIYSAALNSSYDQCAVYYFVDNGSCQNWGLCNRFVFSKNLTNGCADSVDGYGFEYTGVLPSDGETYHWDLGASTPNWEEDEQFYPCLTRNIFQTGSYQPEAWKIYSCWQTKPVGRVTWDYHRVWTGTMWIYSIKAVEVHISGDGCPGPV